MKVYIANFGASNWAWPECLAKSSIAVMDDTRVHPYWISGDRDGYISECQRVLKLARGGTVTNNVASRWFNLNNIFRETVGDIWIHREKEELWWTISTDAAVASEVRPDPVPTHGSKEIDISFKACSGWSNTDKRGIPLLWNALHPKAKTFLFTEGTYQKLSLENAAYALALIEGEDRSPWHSQSAWGARVAFSKKGEASIADAWKRTAVRLADSALAVVNQSGMVTVSISKVKELGFDSKQQLEAFIEGLLRDSDGQCALTSMQIVRDGDDGDKEFAASLDRIDSSRGYERENLQIVCRFANRWKSSSDDLKFRQLIAAVRNHSVQFEE